MRGTSISKNQDPKNSKSPAKGDSKSPVQSVTKPGTKPTVTTDTKNRPTLKNNDLTTPAMPVKPNQKSQTTNYTPQRGSKLPNNNQMLNISLTSDANSLQQTQPIETPKSIDRSPRANTTQKKESSKTVTKNPRLDQSKPKMDLSPKNKQPIKGTLSNNNRASRDSGFLTGNKNSLQTSRISTTAKDPNSEKPSLTSKPRDSKLSNEPQVPTTTQPRDSKITGATSQPIDSRIPGTTTPKRDSKIVEKPITPKIVNGKVANQTNGREIKQVELKPTNKLPIRDNRAQHSSITNKNPLLLNKNNSQASGNNSILLNSQPISQEGEYVMNIKNENTDANVQQNYLESGIFESEGNSVSRDRHKSDNLGIVKYDIQANSNSQKHVSRLVINSDDITANHAVRRPSQSQIADGFSNKEFQNQTPENEKDRKFLRMVETPPPKKASSKNVAQGQHVESEELQALGFLDLFRKNDTLDMTPDENFTLLAGFNVETVPAIQLKPGRRTLSHSSSRRSHNSMESHDTDRKSSTDSLEAYQKESGILVDQAIHLQNDDTKQKNPNKISKALINEVNSQLEYYEQIENTTEHLELQPDGHLPLKPGKPKQLRTSQVHEGNAKSGPVTGHNDPNENRAISIRESQTLGLSGAKMDVVTEMQRIELVPDNILPLKSGKSTKRVRSSRKTEMTHLEIHQMNVEQDQESENNSDNESNELVYTIKITAPSQRQAFTEEELGESQVVPTLQAITTKFSLFEDVQEQKQENDSIQESEIQAPQKRVTKITDTLEAFQDQTMIKDEKQSGNAQYSILGNFQEQKNEDDSKQQSGTQPPRKRVTKITDAFQSMESQTVRKDGKDIEITRLELQADNHLPLKPSHRHLNTHSRSASYTSNDVLEQQNVNNEPSVYLNQVNVDIIESQQLNTDQTEQINEATETLRVRTSSHYEQHSQRSTRHELGGDGQTILLSTGYHVEVRSQRSTKNRQVDIEESSTNLNYQVHSRQNSRREQVEEVSVTETVALLESTSQEQNAKRTTQSTNDKNTQFIKPTDKNFPNTKPADPKLQQQTPRRTTQQTEAQMKGVTQINQQNTGSKKEVKNTVERNKSSTRTGQQQTQQSPIVKVDPRDNNLKNTSNIKKESQITKQTSGKETTGSNLTGNQKGTSSDNSGARKPTARTTQTNQNVVKNTKETQINQQSGDKVVKKTTASGPTGAKPSGVPPKKPGQQMPIKANDNKSQPSGTSQIESKTNTQVAQKQNLSQDLTIQNNIEDSVDRKTITSESDETDYHQLEDDELNQMIMLRNMSKLQTGFTRESNSSTKRRPLFEHEKGLLPVKEGGTSLLVKLQRYEGHESILHPGQDIPGQEEQFQTESSRKRGTIVIPLHEEALPVKASKRSYLKHPSRFSGRNAHVEAINTSTKDAHQTTTVDSEKQNSLSESQQESLRIENQEVVPVKPGHRVLKHASRISKHDPSTDLNQIDDANSSEHQTYNSTHEHETTVQQTLLVVPLGDAGDLPLKGSNREFRRSYRVRNSSRDTNSEGLEIQPTEQITIGQITTITGEHGTIDQVLQTGETHLKEAHQELKDSPEVKNSSQHTSTQLNKRDASENIISEVTREQNEINEQDYMDRIGEVGDLPLRGGSRTYKHGSLIKKNIQLTGAGELTDETSESQIKEKQESTEQYYDYRIGELGDLPLRGGSRTYKHGSLIKKNTQQSGARELTDQSSDPQAVDEENEPQQESLKEFRPSPRENPDTSQQDDRNDSQDSSKKRTIQESNPDLSHSTPKQKLDSPKLATEHILGVKFEQVDVVAHENIRHSENITGQDDQMPMNTILQSGFVSKKVLLETGDGKDWKEEIEPANHGNERHRTALIEDGTESHPLKIASTIIVAQVAKEAEKAQVELQSSSEGESYDENELNIAIQRRRTGVMQDNNPHIKLKQGSRKFTTQNSSRRNQTVIVVNADEQNEEENITASGKRRTGIMQDHNPNIPLKSTQRLLSTHENNEIQNSDIIDDSTPMTGLRRKGTLQDNNPHMPVKASGRSFNKSSVGPNLLAQGGIGKLLDTVTGINTKEIIQDNTVPSNTESRLEDKITSGTKFLTEEDEDPVGSFNGSKRRGIMQDNNPNIPLKSSQNDSPIPSSGKIMLKEIQEEQADSQPGSPKKGIIQDSHPNLQLNSGTRSGAKVTPETKYLTEQDEDPVGSFTDSRRKGLLQDNNPNVPIKASNKTLHKPTSRTKILSEDEHDPISSRANSKGKDTMQGNNHDLPTKIHSKGFDKPDSETVLGNGNDDEQMGSGTGNKRKALFQDNNPNVPLKSGTKSGPKATPETKYLTEQDEDPVGSFTDSRRKGFMQDNNHNVPIKASIKSMRKPVSVTKLLPEEEDGLVNSQANSNKKDIIQDQNPNAPTKSSDLGSNKPGSDPKTAHHIDNDPVTPGFKNKKNNFMEEVSPRTSPHPEKNPDGRITADTKDLNHQIKTENYSEQKESPQVNNIQLTPHSEINEVNNLPLETNLVNDADDDDELISGNRNKRKGFTEDNNPHVPLNSGKKQTNHISSGIKNSDKQVLTYNYSEPNELPQTHVVNSMIQTDIKAIDRSSLGTQFVNECDDDDLFTPRNMNKKNSFMEDISPHIPPTLATLNSVNLVPNNESLRDNQKKTIDSASQLRRNEVGNNDDRSDHLNKDIHHINKNSHVHNQKTIEEDVRPSGLKRKSIKEDNNPNIVIKSKNETSLVQDIEKQSEVQGEKDLPDKTFPLINVVDIEESNTKLVANRGLENHLVTGNAKTTSETEILKKQKSQQSERVKQDLLTPENNLSEKKLCNSKTITENGILQEFSESVQYDPLRKINTMIQFSGARGIGYNEAGDPDVKMGKFWSESQNHVEQNFSEANSEQQFRRANTANNFTGGHNTETNISQDPPKPVGQFWSQPAQHIKTIQTTEFGDPALKEVKTLTQVNNIYETGSSEGFQPPSFAEKHTAFHPTTNTLQRDTPIDQDTMKKQFAFDPEPVIRVKDYTTTVDNGKVGPKLITDPSQVITSEKVFDDPNSSELKSNKNQNEFQMALQSDENIGATAIFGPVITRESQKNNNRRASNARPTFDRNGNMQQTLGYTFVVTNNPEAKDEKTKLFQIDSEINNIPKRNNNVQYDSESHIILENSYFEKNSENASQESSPLSAKVADFPYNAPKNPPRRESMVKRGSKDQTQIVIPPNGFQVQEEGVPINEFGNNGRPSLSKNTRNRESLPSLIRTGSNDKLQILVPGQNNSNQVEGVLPEDKYNIDNESSNILDTFSRPKSITDKRRASIDDSGLPVNRHPNCKPVFAQPVEARSIVSDKEDPNSGKNINIDSVGMETNPAQMKIEQPLKPEILIQTLQTSHESLITDKHNQNELQTNQTNLNNQLILPRNSIVNAPNDFDPMIENQSHKPNQTQEGQPPTQDVDKQLDQPSPGTDKENDKISNDHTKTVLTHIEMKEKPSEGVFEIISNENDDKIRTFSRQNIGLTESEKKETPITTVEEYQAPKFDSFSGPKSQRSTGQVEYTSLIKIEDPGQFEFEDYHKTDPQSHARLSFSSTESPDLMRNNQSENATEKLESVQEQANVIRTTPGSEVKVGSVRLAELTKNPSFKKKVPLISTEKTSAKNIGVNDPSGSTKNFKKKPSALQTILRKSKEIRSISPQDFKALSSGNQQFKKIVTTEKSDIQQVPYTQSNKYISEGFDVKNYSARNFTGLWTDPRLSETPNTNQPKVDNPKEPKLPLDESPNQPDIKNEIPKNVLIPVMIDSKVESLDRKLDSNHNVGSSGVMKHHLGMSFKAFDKVAEYQSNVHDPNNDSKEFSAIRESQDIISSSFDKLRSEDSSIKPIDGMNHDPNAWYHVPNNDTADFPGSSPGQSQKDSIVVYKEIVPIECRGYTLSLGLDVKSGSSDNDSRARVKQDLFSQTQTLQPSSKISQSLTPQSNFNYHPEPKGEDLFIDFNEGNDSLARNIHKNNGELLDQWNQSKVSENFNFSIASGDQPSNDPSRNSFDHRKDPDDRGNNFLIDIKENVSDMQLKYSHITDHSIIRDKHLDGHSINTEGASNMNISAKINPGLSQRDEMNISSDLKKPDDLENVYNVSESDGTKWIQENLTPQITNVDPIQKISNGTDTDKEDKTVENDQTHPLIVEYRDNDIHQDIIQDTNDAVRLSMDDHKQNDLKIDVITNIIDDVDPLWLKEPFEKDPTDKISNVVLKSNRSSQEFSQRSTGNNRRYSNRGSQQKKSVDRPSTTLTREEATDSVKIFLPAPQDFGNQLEQPKIDGDDPEIEDSSKPKQNPQKPFMPIISDREKYATPNRAENPVVDELDSTPETDEEKLKKPENSKEFRPNPTNPEKERFGKQFQIVQEESIRDSELSNQSPRDPKKQVVDQPNLRIDPSMQLPSATLYYGGLVKENRDRKPSEIEPIRIPNDQYSLTKEQNISTNEYPIEQADPKKQTTDQSNFQKELSGQLPSSNIYYGGLVQENKDRRSSEIEARRSQNDQFSVNKNQKISKNEYPNIQENFDSGDYWIDNYRSEFILRQSKTIEQKEYASFKSHNYLSEQKTSEQQKINTSYNYQQQENTSNYSSTYAYKSTTKVYYGEPIVVSVTQRVCNPTEEEKKYFVSNDKFPRIEGLLKELPFKPTNEYRSVASDYPENRTVISNNVNTKTQVIEQQIVNEGDLEYNSQSADQRLASLELANRTPQNIETSNIQTTSIVNTNRQYYNEVKKQSYSEHRRPTSFKMETIPAPNVYFPKTQIETPNKNTQNTLLGSNYIQGTSTSTRLNDNSILNRVNNQTTFVNSRTQEGTIFTNQANEFQQTFGDRPGYNQYGKTTTNTYTPNIGYSNELTVEKTSQYKSSDIRYLTSTQLNANKTQEFSNTQFHSCQMGSNSQVNSIFWELHTIKREIEYLKTEYTYITNYQVSSRRVTIQYHLNTDIKRNTERLLYLSERISVLVQRYYYLIWYLQSQGCYCYQKHYIESNFDYSGYSQQYQQQTTIDNAFTSTKVTRTHENNNLYQNNQQSGLVEANKISRVELRSIQQEREKFIPSNMTDTQQPYKLPMLEGYTQETHVSQNQMYNYKIQHNDQTRLESDANYSYVSQTPPTVNQNHTTYLSEKPKPLKVKSGVIFQNAIFGENDFPKNSFVRAKPEQRSNFENAENTSVEFTQKNTSSVQVESQPESSRKNETIIRNYILKTPPVNTKAIDIRSAQNSNPVTEQPINKIPYSYTTSYKYPVLENKNSVFVNTIHPQANANQMYQKPNLDSSSVKAPVNQVIVNQNNIIDSKKITDRKIQSSFVVSSNADIDKKTEVTTAPTRIILQDSQIQTTNLVETQKTALWQPQTHLFKTAWEQVADPNFEVRYFVDRVKVKVDWPTTLKSIDLFTKHTLHGIYEKCLKITQNKLLHPSDQHFSSRIILTETDYHAQLREISVQNLDRIVHRTSINLKEYSGYKESSQHYSNFSNSG